MPTILDMNFGRDFFVGPGALENFAEKSLEEFSLRNSPAKLLKFARPS